MSGAAVLLPGSTRKRTRASARHAKPTHSGQRTDGQEQRFLLRVPTVAALFRHGNYRKVITVPDARERQTLKDTLTKYAVCQTTGIPMRNNPIPTAHVAELGGIRSWWVAIPGEPQRCVGRVDELTQQEAIVRGEQLAKQAVTVRMRTQALQDRWPNAQIFRGYLPAYDVEWHGASGEYLYVLRPRRKLGKYVVAEAVKL